jgi:hypothetical protein
MVFFFFSMLFWQTWELLNVVDFRSSMLAFRGAGGEPPAALRNQESHLSSCSG